MKIRDLDKGRYIVVYDMGKSEYSEGMTVVGKVVELEYNEDGKNTATIESMPFQRYTVTDDNYFDYWNDYMENKTEYIGIKRQSNDVQQRKRKDENVGLFKIKDLKVGYKVKVLGDNMTGEVTEIADNGKSAEIQVDDGVYRVINDNYDFTIIEWNAVPEYAEDTVNHPSHYNYGDIEIIDFIEQVTQHYNPNVAYHIGNAIKYLARSPHKNGKEDIEKAKWYIERAFDNWDVK
ncbi:DUF3310 domain-containing protein [Staphylococcus aureus]|uniref:DUF3310 domain-containing protein n=1 Tax=Staphylococcus aureus TaxID=1280 RepID=UPI0013F5976B|nr:DUF3310 domain-containing protein [Staphylococcus aureus]NHE00868.1 DUF3310 domain-containing protein [Staphylococcus aureus]